MPITHNRLTDHEKVLAEPVRAAVPDRPFRPFYLPQLDALRFFAFFAVFLHHALNVSGSASVHSRPLHAVVVTVHECAAFGLSLFFFLSSYLITTLLQAEKAKSGTIALQGFFARRMLRIWPLYFLYLGGVALVGLLVPMFHISVFRWLAMSLLAANWYSIFSGVGSPIISHLWSISVEEQFYAVWPLLFRSVARPVFLSLAIALAVCSLAVTAVAAAHGVSSLGLWLNSGTEFLFFASGAAYALLHKPSQAPNPLAAIALSSSGLMLWFVAETIGQLSKRTAQMSPVRATLGYGLVALSCALLVSGALRFSAGRVPRWLAYLGKISYGLYVFHALALTQLPRAFGHVFRHVPGSSMTAALLTTILLAAFSYRFVEKPFLRLKSRFEVVRTR